MKTGKRIYGGFFVRTWFKICLIYCTTIWKLLGRGDLRQTFSSEVFPWTSKMLWSANLFEDGHKDSEFWLSQLGVTSYPLYKNFCKFGAWYSRGQWRFWRYNFLRLLDFSYFLEKTIGFKLGKYKEGTIFVVSPRACSHINDSMKGIVEVNLWLLNLQKFL